MNLWQCTKNFAGAWTVSKSDLTSRKRLHTVQKVDTKLVPS